MSQTVADNAARYSCLIVEDNTFVALGLNEDLASLGHRVAGIAHNAAEAEALFRSERPDVVIMDVELKGDDGIELAGRLLKERACPIVVLTAYADKSLVDRAAATGVFGYMIKPSTPAGLAAQIEVAVNRFREYMVLLAEKQALSSSLETRKLVDRAKGILMKRSNLTEPEAHKRLQGESQKRRIGLADLARKIIESEELLTGL